MSYRIRAVPKKKSGPLPLPLDDVKSWGDEIRAKAGPILGVSFLFAVVLAAIGGYFYFQADNAARASLALSQASGLYDSAANPGSNREENLKQALSRFSEIEKNFPRRVEAKISAYYVGNTKFALGDFSGAAEAYRSYAGRYPDDKTLQPFIKLRLALALERQGDTDGAVKTLGELAKTEDAPNQDQAYFEQARLFEGKDQKVGAVAAYQEVVKNFPDSPLSIVAAERIAALSGGQKGPAKESPSP